MYWAFSLIALSEMLLKIPIEEYKSPLTEAVTRRGHGRSVFSVSIDTHGEKAMFTAACAMFTMFSLTHHCSASTNISTRKTTIVRGNLKTFPKQEKEKCKYVSLFLMFQHAVNFFGGVYLCPNTPCLPVCGANG